MFTMKNIKNLRDLEDLPIDTLSFQIKGKDWKDKWDRRYKKSDYHSPNQRFRQIWSYIDWFLKKRIGQPFDDVFSEFCKIVPKYSQKFFLKEFEISNPEGIIYWYLDDEGLIRYNDRFPKKRDLTYYSDDYTTEFRNKITGEKSEPDYFNVKYRNRCLHKGCDHNHCSHKREEYHWVIVKGWSKTFDTWSDPEYKKLRAIKRRKQIDSLRKKRNAKRKTIDFHVYIENGKEQRDKNIAWTEQQEYWRLKREENLLYHTRKEYEANLVKIISHGFDPINSFRHKLK